MASNNIISPVPNDQPVLDQRGMISMIWAGFFTQLWNRAGGANSLSNAQLQAEIDAIIQSPANTIKGNNTGFDEETLDLSPSQVTAMLSVFTSLNKGLVPFSGGGTTNFLRADGAWQDPSPLDYGVSSQVTTTSAALTLLAFTTASNSPGFAFTPTKSGIYRIYSSIPTSADGAASARAAVRIFNTAGTATLLSESQAIVSGVTGGVAPFMASVFAQSVYTMSEGVSATFDIQGSLIVGTTLLIDAADCPFYMFAERVS